MTAELRLSPKRAFWTAYFAGLATLAVAVAVMIFLARGGELPFGAILGAMVAAFAASVYAASAWGGRYAAYGALAGFLGTAAAIVLVVFVCALIVFGPSGPIG